MQECEGYLQEKTAKYIPPKNQNGLLSVDTLVAMPHNFIFSI